MSLEIIMEDFLSTDIEAPIAVGIHTETMQNMLDCNDVDGECSIETYED